MGRDLGISVIYQELNLIPDLSVAKNIYLGREPLLPGLLRRVDWARVESESREVIKRLDANIDVRVPVRSLSVADQQMVEIARALAAHPSFMLLDAPLAGIDPIAVNEIRSLIGHLKERGIGVLITDHNVRETLDIVDRAYILHDGKVLMEGKP